MKLVQLGLESHWHAIYSTFHAETMCQIHYADSRNVRFGEGHPDCPTCLKCLPPQEPPQYIHRLASLERIVDELVNRARTQAQTLVQIQEQLAHLRQNAPATAPGSSRSDFEGEPGS